MYFLFYVRSHLRPVKRNDLISNFWAAAFTLSFKVFPFAAIDALSLYDSLKLTLFFQDFV